MKWQWPPDRWFKIQALTIRGQVCNLSVMRERSVSLKPEYYSRGQASDPRLSRQTALPTALGPTPFVLGCPRLKVDVLPVSLSYLSKYQISTLCAGSLSATLAQHCPSIGSMSRSMSAALWDPPCNVCSTRTVIWWRHHSLFRQKRRMANNSTAE